ncbi:hypothetical protein BJF90_13045 [Pseudonocardia sp. CNS-004]|nr:hypothetical protein BJF90_13045 [Pseudonocardia sp. CNS-004]
MRIGLRKVNAENVAPITSRLVDSTSHSRGRRNTLSSRRSGPVAMRSSAGTPLVVARAATTVSTEIAQNAARHPWAAPTNVASGSPSSVPSMRPLITTDIARPRASGRTSATQTDTATPKNACAAVPVTRRASSITE